MLLQFHSAILICGLQKEKLIDRWIYLLTSVELTTGGSSTVHIYTKTIHRTTQLIWEECGPCPVFCELYPGICLTTEEKARKTLSQGRKTSVRVEKPQSG
jgi:uncharacterized integral membrane protein